MARSRMVAWGFLACCGLLSTAVACGGSGGGKDTTGGDAVDVIPLDDLTFPETGNDVDRDVPPTDVVGDVPVEIPCIAECTTAGDRQCAPGVQGFWQACEMSEAGCLKWGVAQDCGTGKACDGGQCLATCQSDPGCAAAGDKRCGSAKAFQACAEVAAGCFKYGEEQACPGAAVCVGDGTCECQHACVTVGDRKCFGAEANLFQSCVEDPAGCRVWGEPAACEGSAVCKGTGICEEVCTSDCPQEGDLRCASGTAYELCMTVQPGCLKWGAPVACPGSLTCTGAGQCQVVCVPDAGCDVTGRTGCTDDGLLRSCEDVAPGCLKWGVAAACPLHQACTGGACACEAPCTDGASECVAEVDPHFTKACRTDDASCTYWAYEDCGGGATCSAGACVTICGSDPGCTSVGVTRCESRETFSTCAEVADHAGCIQFGGAAACPDHQECQEATGACACRVEAGCTAADAKRCIDYDNAATCKADEKGCLHWGAPEACPEGNTCSDGVCGPLCVSDLDCTSAGLNRCTAEGLLQTCVEVPGATGCIKWAPPQACPAHQVCSDASGCVCDNPCVPDQSRCIGLSQRQTCSAPDLLGCTNWATAEACAAGDSCVKGECRTIVSPVVACGVITFHLVNEGYSEVQVSGNFQGPTWVSTPATLVDGVWTVTVEVTAAGRYEYKFIADGTWVRDPLNPDFAGTPPLDNSVVEVKFLKTCDVLGDGRCTTAGTLETCQDDHGCIAWLPPEDNCSGSDRYCDAGVCHVIVSPVVTETSVTFTVRDQGYPVEVSGDFTSPAWGAYFPLGEATGRRFATLLRAEVPGLTVGRHLYKFHAPATGTWFFDPSNPLKEDDGLGGFNSVFVLAPPCVPGCDTPGATRCADFGHMETCGTDTYGCAAWVNEACTGVTACLREKCEAEPVIDATAKTATFVVLDDTSAAVRVRGDFTPTPWSDTEALSLTKTGGVWVGTTAPLAPGTYKYKLQVGDGATWTWIRDPRNPFDDGSADHNNLFTIP